MYVFLFIYIHCTLAPVCRDNRESPASRQYEYDHYQIGCCCSYKYSTSTTILKNMSNVTRRRSSELQESVVIVKHSSSSDYLSAFQQRNLAHSQSLNSISKQKSFGYQNKPEVTRQNSTEFVTKTTKRLHETLDNRARVVTRSIRKESYTVQTNQVIDDLLTCPVCQFQMTINSQRLFEIQERLENLLTEKKVLNSKIVADSFKNFQSQVTKVGFYGILL